MQLQHSEYASLDGYELFRRAIEERDELAWAESAARYRRMLIFWARRCIARTTIGECCDDIVDYAFTRAWKALSPERFAGFSSLAALLGYLRGCVSTAVIDCARHEMMFDRLFQVIEADNVATPEQIVLDQLDHSKLWQIVNSVVQNDQEQHILIESYASPSRRGPFWSATRVCLPMRPRSTLSSATCSIGSRTAPRCSSSTRSEWPRDTLHRRRQQGNHHPSQSALDCLIRVTIAYSERAELCQRPVPRLLRASGLTASEPTSRRRVTSSSRPWNTRSLPPHLSIAIGHPA